MKDKYTVAVVGATGAVGNEMVSILEERNFPVGDLRLLASERSEGKQIEFKGKKEERMLAGIEPINKEEKPSHILIGPSGMISDLAEIRKKENKLNKNAMVSYYISGRLKFKNGGK